MDRYETCNYISIFLSKLNELEKAVREEIEN